LTILLCAAPAQAATVSWHNTGAHTTAEISVQGGPAELNYIELQQEPKVPGRPQVVRVIDRGVSPMKTTGPVTPGVCHTTSCTVPCPIVAPNEARCSLADGYRYGPVNLPGGSPPDTFWHADVNLGDGPDRFFEPVSSGVFSTVHGDGGDGYTLHGKAELWLTNGDHAEFVGPPAVSGGSTVYVGGDAEVFADDGAQQHIVCRSSVAQRRFEVDRLDTVERCDPDLDQEGGLLP
jgi:hypothetical protein